MNNAKVMVPILKDTYSGHTNNTATEMFKANCSLNESRIKYATAPTIT